MVFNVALDFVEPETIEMVPMLICSSMIPNLKVGVNEMALSLSGMH